MGNTFGKVFLVTTFGESHGAAMGAVIDGCPSQIPLTEAGIQRELDRRRPGQSEVTTSRREEDKIKILSGIFEGKTLGTPIAMIVENKDARSEDYEKFKEIYRPGHADFVWEKKFGIRDYRGGGRSSGRETVSRVMGGAVAKAVLRDPRFGRGIEIFAYAKQIGEIIGEKVDLSFIEKNPVRSADPKKAPEMEAYIKKIKEEGDSVGGVVEILVKKMLLGLGEPVFDKLNADLAKALFSIPTVKAVEFGEGKRVATLKGSEHNPLQGTGAMGGGGGISGGISTGEDLMIRVTVKPPSSISKEQETHDKNDKKVKIQVTGRHDPCIIPRFIPVAEAMVALTLVDHLLRYRALADTTNRTGSAATII